MKTLSELTHHELISIQGGTEAPTFAYRVGQTVRFLGLSNSTGTLFGNVEYAWNMTFGLV